tara:strand:- start:1199 stop:1981 length:783 start_codon:yes stop_codon:yes gene_type:complete
MSDLDFVRADMLALDGLAHAFTTRSGGVSEAPYDSLNLSWKDGDNKAHIAENRARVTAALGLDKLVFANQVHGKTVHRVDAAPVGVWSVGEGDALMSDVPGLGLVAQTADCTPILLFDLETQACAAIHSGWRGTVQNIAGETVAAMGREYGTQPDALFAAIGPAISAQNYRVGPEVLEQFEALFGTLDGLALTRDAEGGAGLDVSEACRRQLVAAGIPQTQVERINACTFDDPRFFSSRRAKGGQFGGQGGIIGLTNQSA